MSYKSSYVRGDHKGICDACGRLFKASSLRKRWDGVQVCSSCWEPRQTQDFVRGVADIQAPGWTRSEATDTYNHNLQGMPWVAMFAIAGSMYPGLIPGIGLVPSGTFTP